MEGHGAQLLGNHQEHVAVFAHVARVVADAAGEPLVQFGLGLESVAGPEASDLKICCLVG